MADLKENGCALLNTGGTAVDLNAAPGATTLYETPAGKKMVPHYVVVRNLSADALIAAGSFGQVGALTDFLGIQTLGTNLSAAGTAGICMPIPAAVTVGVVEYTAGEIFQFDLTTAAGGACTCTMDVYGSLADA